MGTSSYGPTTVTVDNGPELVDRVTSTAGAVGFVRAGYVNSTADVTVVPVSASGGPAYDATDFDAAYNGSYALGRYYYLYTDGPLAGARGVWASFILDPEHGQRVLADHGFLPLRETDRENSTSNVAPDAAVTGYRIVRAAPDGSSREFNVNSTQFVDSGVPAGTYTYTVSAVYASGLADATPLTVTVPAGGTASTPSYFGLSAWTLVAVGLGVAAVVVVIAIHSASPRVNWMHSMLPMMVMSRPKLEMPASSGVRKSKLMPKVPGTLAQWSTFLVWSPQGWDTNLDAPSFMALRR